MQRHFDSYLFRRTMGTFATGVTVVTTPDPAGVHGMTANAFTSVSLEPPLVLVSVDKKANTHRHIQKAKCFGVNILKTSQTKLANHFAGQEDPELEKALTYAWHDDIPFLPDTLASIACRLWANYDGGDHTLYVGEVAALEVSEGDPLLFYRGSYRQLAQLNPYKHQTGQRDDLA